MKKYRVTVNGTVYEVELEELTGSVPVSAPAAPAAAPAPAASAAPAAGEQICAPMPGNILAVNVTAGQTVKKGDVLMVLEAMKMENEIMCPRDGVVASVTPPRALPWSPARCCASSSKAGPIWTRSFAFYRTPASTSFPRTATGAASSCWASPACCCTWAS